MDDKTIVHYEFGARDLTLALHAAEWAGWRFEPSVPHWLVAGDRAVIRMFFRFPGERQVSIVTRLSMRCWRCE
jgi:hypothetical protein